jgi:epoxyqueuosine reductase
MDWMDRRQDKRIDIRKIFPEIRSVAVIALNYYTNAEHPGTPETGKISRYAWGEDYHTVVAERLDQLLAALRAAEPQAKGLTYVDTGPIMEKAWAERAGIGWRGKHTNVITQELGSWVFLGVLLLNIDCEYDSPATDHCGTCTLCIDACPTEAIVAPYVLDASRCLSYLTIEHRGEIPSEFAGLFEGWLFGCDICQDVCPWNDRFARPTQVQEFFPRPGAIAPRIEEAVRITPDKFRDMFTGSPVMRTRHAGFVRNAKFLEQQQKDQ